MSNGRHLAKGSPMPDVPEDGILRLYSMRFCPFAQRVHLVLDAKQIPYHSIYINLTDKPEWLLEVSTGQGAGSRNRARTWTTCAHRVATDL
nr:glutathione S-transferase omega class [Drosophila melanogaster]